MTPIGTHECAKRFGVHSPCRPVSALSVFFQVCQMHPEGFFHFSSHQAACRASSEPASDRALRPLSAGRGADKHLYYYYARRSGIAASAETARGSSPSWDACALERSVIRSDAQVHQSIIFGIGKCTVGECAHIDCLQRSACAIVGRKPHAEDRGSVCGLSITRCPAVH